MLLFNLYLSDPFKIYRDGITGYKESACKFSSHSEKLYIFTNITKFSLNCIITVFYTLVLVFLY